MLAKDIKFGCPGKCPVCLFVFCLACSKASHGNAQCKEVPQNDIGDAVGEVEQAGGKDNHHGNRDYEVFQAMFKKSGPKRYQQTHFILPPLGSSHSFQQKYFIQEKNKLKTINTVLGK